ncbi:MAG: PEGA domain-containing protein, partial [Myxococcota bacterium]
LGSSYILNIKVVESSTGKRLGRISSKPLRGTPDELIDAVRVAAYRLLAPDQVLGSISVLSDLVGATVYLDGKEVGKTPLPSPIYRLAVRPHRLEVKADGYLPFDEQIEVRFQKSTRVVVRLASEQPVVQPASPPIVRKRQAATPWYTSRWFYVGVGVAAAALGGYVGYRIGRDPVVDCSVADACTM